MRDTIPKSIGYFLVKASQERLQFELYSQINKNEALTRSLGEPERVAEERKQLNTTLEILKKALKVLLRDPDITNTAFGEDELADELRQDALQRKHEETKKSNPPMGGGNPGMGAPNGMGGMGAIGGMGGPPGGQQRPMGMAPNGAPPGGVRPPGMGPPMGAPGMPGQPRPMGPPGQGTGNLFGSGAGGDPLARPGVKPNN